MSTKFVAKFIGVAMVLSLAVAGVATPAQGATVEELQAQIDALLAQLATLGGSSSSSTSCYTYTRDLTLGSTGADVVELQTMLVAKGNLVMPAGVSKGYFGALTKTALAAYQAANGISPAAGYFGSITRAKVAATCSTTGSTTGSTTSDDLEGGAGSVDSYTLISGLNNEEVGEGEEDKEVAGIEIENSDGSDINITAVKLNFDVGTANKDLDDYVAEVSIWLDGEEVARVDADKFNDDNAYQATISMDEDAIIEAGEKAELTVALSGIDNLDSADATDTWTVDINSIRFVDAQGATVSEDPTTDARTFSLQTFATAADVILKVATGDDDVNDAKVVNVHASDDTDGVEVFAFTLEAEGDSDVEVKDVPIKFVTVGADLDGIANTAYLEVDGETIASETIASTATTTTVLLFDDVDYTIDAGDTVEVIVKLDVNDIDAGTFDEGDTLYATFGETETDNSTFDAEDETGENLGDADKSGTATSGTHTFYDVGMQVELVSVSQSSTVDDGNDDDSATFIIKYKVTAFDGDVFVSDTATATSTATNTSTTVASNQVLYLVDKSGTATTADLTGSVVSFTKDGTKVTDTGVTNGVKVTEGSTGNFTLTVVRQNSGDSTDNGSFRTTLRGISWATSDAAAQNIYSFNLEDFQTDYVTIN